MKNRYRVLIEVNVYQSEKSGFRPIQWTWCCTAKNQLEAINQVLRCYNMGDYGYPEHPYKIDLAKIISVTKVKL